MQIPGFTAESSLYTSGKSWRCAGRPSQPGVSQLIRPQTFVDYYFLCKGICGGIYNTCRRDAASPDDLGLCSYEYTQCMHDCWLRYQAPL